MPPTHFSPGDEIPAGHHLLATELGASGALLGGANLYPNSTHQAGRRAVSFCTLMLLGAVAVLGTGAATIGNDLTQPAASWLHRVAARPLHGTLGAVWTY